MHLVTKTDVVFRVGAFEQFGLTDCVVSADGVATENGDDYNDDNGNGMVALWLWLTKVDDLCLEFVDPNIGFVEAVGIGFKHFIDVEQHIVKVVVGYVG